MNRKKKILVAPLDWGLGHATRCIPVISELEKQGAEVIIASDGRSLDLLKKEFPHLKFIRLKGYRIFYYKNLSMPFTILLQFPKIIRAVRSEHRELKKIICEERINAVISDNRYGLHSKEILCVFITHQIGIVLPRSLKIAEWLVYRINKFFIDKYNECWIPDSAGKKNLSGKLSHLANWSGKERFIGVLSRFKSKEDIPKQYDILVILSGPEPQRTLLENLLKEQIIRTSLRTLLVRGITEETVTEKITENFSAVSFLDSEQLNTAILAADIIISRSGYSTIMDLAVLGKKAILIPTPGQTEQEYLADSFKEKGIFYSEPQKDFSLQRAMDNSKDYKGIKITDNNLLPEVIGNFLKSLG